MQGCKNEVKLHDEKLVHKRDLQQGSSIYFTILSAMLWQSLYVYATEKFCTLLIFT